MNMVPVITDFILLVSERSMIISRYFLQQVFRSVVAVTLVLLLIFICQQMVRYLSYAASGKMAVGVMFSIIGYQIPILLALMLPPGLYFAILLTYGRLYGDNELWVLHACGFSPRKLIRITLMAAAPVFLLTVMLTFWVNPKIAAQRQQALLVNAEKNVFETLMPGRFRVDQDGERVIYAEKISRDHRNASNIFVAWQKPAVKDQDTRWTVLSATGGYQQMNPPGLTGQFLVAEKGYRYEGIPGHRDYRIFHFDRYAVRLPDIEIGTRSTILDTLSGQALLKRWPDPDAAAELQWRLSVPLSVLLLALLAVPLSRVAPRKSRYRVMLPAMLLYVIYMNLLIGARHLMEQQSVPVGIGLWWVHLLCLAVVVSAVAWSMKRV